MLLCARRLDFSNCTFLVRLRFFFLFLCAPSRSISIHPRRLAVMTVISSAITAAVNGILILTLKTDYHIV